MIVILLLKRHAKVLFQPSSAPTTTVSTAPSNGTILGTVTNVEPQEVDSLDEVDNSSPSLESCNITNEDAESIRNRCASLS